MTSWPSLPRLELLRSEHQRFTFVTPVHNHYGYAPLLMTTTTDEFGKQNLFAKEPQMYISQTDAERYGYETYAERAEKLNSRAAMLGFVAGIISYAITGNFFFGVL